MCLESGLQPKTLPKTAAFFARTADFDKDAVKEAKNYWLRPRPAEISTQVHPLAKEKPNDWSYPSGHSTFGYTTAVLLANMLPEKRAAIFARADLYAQHRIVMGAHFPSDIEAGHLAGTVIADDIMHDPSWRRTMRPLAQSYVMRWACPPIPRRRHRRCPLQRRFIDLIIEKGALRGAFFNS